MMKPGDIVVAPVVGEASNTFIVHRVLEDIVQVKHPLYPAAILEFNIDELNKELPRIKDSSERSIDYANHHRSALSPVYCADLDALSLYFLVVRKLTPKQKGILAAICGEIATIKFNNELKAAMRFIQEHSVLLDDFNLMWYENFAALFSGNQPISSKKQKSAIFNMAGFLLSELHQPSQS
jgi:hypothetical protein